MKLLLSFMTLLLFVSACGNKIPEPESHDRKRDFLDDQTASAASVQSDRDEEYEVKYSIRGNSLYVDCFLRDFTFSSATKKPRALVRLSMDGKKMNDYRTAAFLFKKLPEGKHEIKLEIFHENGKPTGLEKNFTVEIDSAV